LNRTATPTSAPVAISRGWVAGPPKYTTTAPTSGSIMNSSQFAASAFVSFSVAVNTIQSSAAAHGARGSRVWRRTICASSRPVAHTTPIRSTCNTSMPPTGPAIACVTA